MMQYVLTGQISAPIVDYLHNTPVIFLEQTVIFEHSVDKVAEFSWEEVAHLIGILIKNLDKRFLMVEMD